MVENTHQDFDSEDSESFLSNSHLNNSHMSMFIKYLHKYSDEALFRQINN